jgi:chemotaxis signal transduction protein
MSTETKAAPGRLTGKYLTFNLQAESYGIDVLKVREIIRLAVITPVPQMPPHIRGVINLRGKIIPVMDLRVRFEFAAANTEQTCIIVAQVKSSTSPPATLKRRRISADKFAPITSSASPRSRAWSRRCWTLTASWGRTR